MSRDLIGYGESPPAARWPGGARVAVNIVINYEEGSENRREDGQASREGMGEAPSPVPLQDRDLANESFFEYGSRAGYWRLLRVLDAHRVRGTIFACAVAFEANPAAVRGARTFVPTAIAGRSTGSWTGRRSAQPSRAPLPQSRRRPVSRPWAGTAAMALPSTRASSWWRSRRSCSTAIPTRTTCPIT